ncbi:molybdenum cofactor biosynthesis protein MoaE [Synechococcus sp. A15-127]|uniref:molybdopterin synthase catalytic subunit n=1 Tax=Synechococcus sp. A15-127 TaxID=1050624 RepID=UPI001644B99F|nr:molybdenum cofactor biosynthesis protein MoaE [Synechococcus sp. A15-127]
MATVQVEIRMAAFDPWQELSVWGGHAAASAVFIGRVRAMAMDGRVLQALELEHYPGLCERLLEAIAERLRQTHAADRVLVLHRVGRLSPGEPIVLVAVEADHRGPAQRCAADLLEELKHRAPFWKREWCGDQGVWLNSNTSLWASDPRARGLSPEP